MIYPLTRIVDRPEVGAAVLVDLNDELVATQAGFDFGDPDFTVSVDDGSIVEGQRSITLPLVLRGSRGEVARRLADLAMQVARRGRWLLWQWAPESAPTWFRLVPTAPGSLDLNLAFVDATGPQQWSWDLTLTADAFTRGQRVTYPAVTVTNTGGDRGFTLTAAGDVPAPLRIDLAPSHDLHSRRVLVSTFSVPAGSSMVTAGGAPHLIASDASFTPQGPASRVTGQSHLSGTDGISIPVSTTTATVVADGTWPWSPAPGTYAVYARLYRVGGSGHGRFRMAQVSNGIASWQGWSNDPTSPSWWRPEDGGNRASWHRIGILRHPMGARSHGLRDGDVIAPSIQIQFQGSDSGSSSTIIIDQLALIPLALEEGSCTVGMFDFTAGQGPTPTTVARIDGDTQRVSIIDGFGKVHPRRHPQVAGGWPTAWPGMVTCVTTLLDTSPAPSGVDSVAQSSTLTASIQPRHIHLAGGA